MNIIAFSGSLRRDSYNTALIRAAKQLAPDGMDISIVDISSLPLYNQDLETEFPAEATALKEAVEAADGIIIATPEFNRSLSGVLKNALDWLSRPWGKNSLTGKPVLALGASPSAIGTALAQAHLKQILLFLDARVIGQPEFYLNHAEQKFSDDGTLTDEDTKNILIAALSELAARI